MIKCTLRGQMPSGKNRIKEAWVRGRKIRYPDARFKAWRLISYKQLQDQCGSHGMISGPSIIRVLYWPGDLRTRDVPGMMDALCHLLEFCPHCKTKSCALPIMRDDSLLVNWAWVTMPLDRKNPRVEFSIEEIS